MADESESTLSKFAGLFWKPDTPAPGKAPAPPATAVAAPGGKMVAVALPYDEEALKTLQGVIGARKTGYTALVDTAATLTVIPDEATRFKAAYQVLSAQGRTLKEIVSSIDVHSSDLEQERLRFKAAAEKNVQTNCQTLRAAADGLDARVKQNNDEIGRLQQRIAELVQDTTQSTQDAASKRTEADAAEANVRAVEEKFNRTVDYLKADLAAKKQTLAAILA